MRSTSSNRFSVQNNKRLLMSLFTLGGLMIVLGLMNTYSVNALPGGAVPLPATGSQHTFTTNNGGSVTVTATFIGPSSPQGSLCANNRDRPNFSRYISDTGITVGPSSSVLHFDLDFSFRSCDKAIKNYAIFSPTFCEQAGWYGAGDLGKAFDCVKYAAAPPDNVNNPALGCSVNGSNGSGNPCVIQPFFNQIRRDSPSPYAPPNSLVDRRVNDRKLPLGNGVINGLGLDTNSNNSRDFDADLCQYWKYTDDSAISSDNDNDDDCKRVAFNISWRYTPPPSYELEANVDTLGDTFTYYKNFSNYNWSARVASSSNLPADGIGNHDVDLWRIVYPGAISAWNKGAMTGDAGPCASLPGSQVAGGECVRVAANACVNGVNGCGNPLTGTGQYWNWQHNENLGPYNAGTSVCYISRVSKPTYTSTNSDWRGSAQQCSKSVKKPRAQFVGSDLRVGGVIQSSPYTVRGNYYGSWGEYGVLSGGGNFLAGSGNAFRTPSTSSGADISKLTFRNDDQTNLGYYEGLGQSTAFDYFRGLTDTGPAITTPPTTTGVYNYTPGTLGRLNATAGGSSIIIKHSGTLRITDNITVPNNGVTNANALSQVVIVADNIEIAPNVTQVDAWLLANPTGGFINTCSDLSTLTTGVCSNFLQVNGPILTDRLYLRRTAGANLPEANIKDPAEKFNLRPDAQLWAYSYANKADFAQTDYVQELPPRY